MQRIDHELGRRFIINKENRLGNELIGDCEMLFKSKEIIIRSNSGIIDNIIGTWRTEIKPNFFVHDNTGKYTINFHETDEDLLYFNMYSSMDDRKSNVNPIVSFIATRAK